MGKFGKSDNRTCGQTGHCPAMSGVRQPDGHGHLPRYMSCLSGLSGRSVACNYPATSTQASPKPHSRFPFCRYGGQEIHTRNSECSWAPGRSSPVAKTVKPARDIGLDQKLLSQSMLTGSHRAPPPALIAGRYRYETAPVPPLDAGMAGRHQARGRRAFLGDECCSCCR